jgi:dipeptidyl-peptidase-4
MTKLSKKFIFVHKIVHMKIRITLLGISLSLFTFAQDLTVERIWKSGEFYGKGVEGFTSLADGEHFTKIVSEGSASPLKRFTFKDFSGKGELILNLSELKFNGKTLAIDDATLSPSGKLVLIQTETESIYRHSYKANFYVYEVASKNLRKVHAGNELQTLATLSPDERTIAYVSENNLYTFDLTISKNRQFTTDGKRNTIINGTTDWVYEEEFAITQGFQFSPDSKFIGFMRFDESNVKEFQMAMYGELYPDQYTFKYPKAGEDNSKVTFHILNLQNGEVAPVNLGAFEYLPRFKWSPVTNEIVVLTMNRHQNELSYHLIQNPTQPTDKVIYKETSDTYIDIDDNLTILKDGKSLLRTSEKDGFNHIYQLKFDGTQKALTSGKWDVIELY